VFDNNIQPLDHFEGTRIMESPPSSPRSVVTADLEQRSPNSGTTSTHGGNALLFPWKLHDMLRSSNTEGKESIVSWLPHGNAFKVHNVPDFVSNILPLFFKQTKYKSFQRQLNLWGFERIQNGSEKGAYYHKQFLRDDSALCRHLTRQRAKKVSSAITNVGGATNVNGTTKSTSSFPKKPRKVSLEGFEELLGKFDSKNCHDPLDLGNFEGFTFHLLEQDRYEELEARQDQKNITALLKELEQGVFGIPKMALKPLDTRPSC